MNTLYKLIITFSLFGITSLHAVAEDFEKGLLWKVSGNDLDKPSYIFGTLHLICPDDFTIFPGTEEAIGKAEQVVLELDLTDQNLLMAMQREIMMKEGLTLKDILTEKDYDMVSGFFTDSLGMQIQMFQTMQPFFIQTLLYPHMIDCQPTSYEQYFITQANAHELPVAGLETLEEQLNVFKALTYQQQAEMLVKTIKEFGSQSKEFQEMVEGYIAQDLALIMDMFAKMIEETGGGFEEFNFRLMKERNHRWIPRMEEMMNEKPVFFAVGAGHLSGEDGILKLLVAQGYTVEMVE
ncbi:MAG: TraB/GumN family protein [Bacteroidota bacterium]